MGFLISPISMRNPRPGATEQLVAEQGLTKSQTCYPQSSYTQGPLLSWLTQLHT